MPIPALDHRGLLPHGVHHCLLQEAKGQFALPGYREALWEDMILFIEEQVLPNGLRLPVFLAGSFFSDKTNPSDIEFLLDLDQATDQQFCNAMILYRRHDEIKDRYRVDYYPNITGPGQNDFSLFFQYVGPKTAQAKGLQPQDKRGILRIQL